jgi:hypothetical protein
MVNVKVKRAGKKVDSESQPVNLGDIVSWQIDTITGQEALGITSAYPSILPTTHGSTGGHTVNVTPAFTRGLVKFDLPYTVQIINNGSQTDVATGYLVIDTIGTPTMGHVCEDGREHGHGHGEGVG